MDEMQVMEAPPKTWKAVYTIVERNDKKFWIRVGTAFVNKDQSINVRLDASPTNGQLHIRESEPYGSRKNPSETFAGMGVVS